MEVAALVSAIMTALAPFAATAATAVATSIGNDVYAKGKEGAKRLYEAIKARFAKEEDGSITTQALQKYVDGSAKYEGLVRDELERLIKADPVFAETLAQFVQSGPLQSLIVGKESVARDIEMNNSLGAGTQKIQEGDNSTVERVRMNINRGDQ
jgi:hypothetical protein